MSGLPIRIFSRRSLCRPLITPMMTISALTATVTPRMAMMLISESSFDPRRLRRYRQAIDISRRVMFYPSRNSERRGEAPKGGTIKAMAIPSLRPQRRKQNDIADVRRVREVHEQPIDPDAHASHWWHSVFHRAQIIFVHT